MAEVRRDYPGGGDYDHHQPIALALAIDLLGVQFDAVIVDEAQDFGDDFWMPMLSDHDRGLLYAFLNENQDIYGRSAAIPIPGDPMVLDRNCRNTNRIHAAAYRYYKGVAVEEPAIAGVHIEILAASDIAKQASRSVR